MGDADKCYTHDIRTVAVVDAAVVETYLLPYDHIAPAGSPDTADLMGMMKSDDVWTEHYVVV